MEKYCAGDCGECESGHALHERTGKDAGAQQQKR